MSPLASATALVTGASSGIGQATALRLAAEGASVALVARRRERLEELAATIAAEGGQALVLAADITDRDQATGVVEATVAHFGRLDVVVNAAGVMLNGPTSTIPMDYWEQMVDLNLKGLMYITKSALPHLLDAAESSERKVTDVVNVSSIAGRVTNATVALYNATKFGVTAATESWRQEFTKHGVRFSVVEPGAVDTELFSQDADMEAHYERTFAGVEKLHAEDIAAAVSYIVTQPRRVAVNEIVIRPTDQA